MSSPPPKRPRIDPPDEDTVDATVSDRPSSTANETVVTSGSRSAERVNPVFGPGYATKFDNFSLLPIIVREAVYSCVDWDTSRALRSVMPETEEYYARRPYKMEVVTLMPLPERSDVLVVRKKDEFFLNMHKWSYKTDYIYRNFHHVQATVFLVEAVSFFADTPSSLEPLRHRPSELRLLLDDPNVDLIDSHLPIWNGRSHNGRRLKVDMDKHPELMVSGTRDWLRYVQPTDSLVLIVGKAMTVPTGVFNLNEVKSAMGIMIICQNGKAPVAAKIDITISQLRALNANSIRFGFEMPSIPVVELLLFVMDKIEAWLVDPDRMYHCLFFATVAESQQLTFVTELSNMKLGARFKTHSVDGGVWIRGSFIASTRSLILEDTTFGRHLLISCGSENTVGIYPLYACEGYDDCQCVIGRCPCKAE